MSREALFLVQPMMAVFLCHFGGDAYPKVKKIHTYGIHGGGFPLR